MKNFNLYGSMFFMRDLYASFEKARIEWSPVYQSDFKDFWDFLYRMARTVLQARRRPAHFQKAASHATSRDRRQYALYLQVLVELSKHYVGTTVEKDELAELDRYHVQLGEQLEEVIACLRVALNEEFIHCHSDA